MFLGGYFLTLQPYQGQIGGPRGPRQNSQTLQIVEPHFIGTSYWQPMTDFLDIIILP